MALDKRIGIVAISSVVGGVMLWLFGAESFELRHTLFQNRAARGLDALVEVVGSARTVEGRLTGGFRYGRLQTPHRSLIESYPDDLRLLAVASELQSGVRSDPSSSNLHAFGIAQLLLGKYNESVKSLEAAATDQPKQAAYQSDLSAAYVARASALGRDDDWPKALAAADRSLTIDDGLLEPRFNRSLAITAMNLQAEAERGWREYLQRDSRSEWAQEAQQRLSRGASADLKLSLEGVRRSLLDAAAAGDREALERAARDHGQETRDLIQDVLLPEWGRNASASPHAAKAGLQQAVSIAEAHSRVSGDRFLVDTLVHANRTLTRSGGRVHDLAEAFALFGDARRLYEQNRVSEAAVLFERAHVGLEATGSPFLLICDDYLAIRDYYRSDYESVRQRERAMLRVADSRSYLGLMARAHWMVGLSYTFDAKYDLQIPEYSRALDLYIRLGERANQAALHSLLSSVYLYTGQRREQWAHTVKALREFDQLMLPRRRHTQLASAANQAIRYGLPEAGLVIADETLSHAESWAAPEALVEAQQYRARALGTLGRHSDAARAVSAAESAAQRVPDPSIRARLQAEVDQTRAETLAFASPQGAVASSERAIGYFTTHNAPLRLPRLQLAKGKALASLGDRARAVEAFTTGIEQFERERAHLPAGESGRVSHFEDAWQLFGELLELSSEHASSEELFAIAERGKAKTLSESVGTRTRADGLVRLQRVLSPAEVFVNFVVLEKKTLAWSISADGVRFRSLPVSRDLLARETRRLRTFLAPGTTGDEWIEPASELFRQLIAPLDLRPEISRRIVFSPDSDLHLVPFGALYDRARSRFLVEDFSISVVPSLDLLIGARDSRLTGGSAARVVVVSVGAAVESAGLLALPGVARESAVISQLFPTARVLSDSNATLQRVQQLGGTADVFHFAGHAVANQEYPERSALFLSDGASGVQPVLAKELSSLGLRNTRLAILSACAVLDGPVAAGEGVLSIGREFLRSGIPTMIATLWEVEDEPASALMRMLYDELAARHTGPESLTRAIRLYMERTSRHPATWAAWTAVGR